MYSDTFESYLVSASLAQRERDLVELHHGHATHNESIEHCENCPAEPRRHRQFGERRPLTAFLRWLTGLARRYSPQS